MYDVKHSNSHSCLVLKSATKYIRLFQEVPNTLINMSYKQIGGYIKNRCVNTGTIRAFLATTDKPFFERAKELVNLGYASDCIANMITNGENEIVKLVCVDSKGNVGSPCGACREYMMQLSKNSKDIEILKNIDTKEIVKLEELIPDWWGKGRV